MRPNAPASPRYAALIELLRAADAVWSASRVFFTRWNLSPSQFNVLNLLRDEPDGLTQTGLSEALIMHRSNLTSLVDQLQARRLVVRRAAPGDRRSWRVVLTADGRRLLGAILPEYFEKIETALADISAARARALADDLERIRRHTLELASSPAATEP